MKRYRNRKRNRDGGAERVRGGERQGQKQRSKKLRKSQEKKERRHNPGSRGSLSQRAEPEKAVASEGRSWVPFYSFALHLWLKCPQLVVTELGWENKLHYFYLSLTEI